MVYGSGADMVYGSGTGKVYGSRAGKVYGSRAGKVYGSRAGKVYGSRAGMEGKVNSFRALILSNEIFTLQIFSRGGGGGITNSPRNPAG